MKTAVGYIRMSTDRQEASPDMQKGIIKEYAAQNDIKIVKWYEDLAISGGSLKNRTSMMELIFDAEKKLFEVVLFFKYDRAFRNVEEQSVVLNKFEKLGIEYKAIKDPEGDGASGRLIRNILGAINQFERELTGERIFYHNREKRKQGKWTGGGFPLGYEYDEETKCLKISPVEANIAVLIKDLYFQYRSCGKVAQELRNRNIHTRNGNLYNNETVSYILRNPVYIGKLRWNHRGPGETEIFDGNHDSLWTEEEFNQIQDILDRNVYNQFGNKMYYLLSGILVCSKCGHAMVGSLVGKQNRKKVKYYCKSRKRYGSEFCAMNRGMRQDILDPIIINKIIRNINNATLNDSSCISNNDSNNNEVEIKRLEKLIEKHKNLYLMDLIDELELKRKTTDLNKEIKKLKSSSKPTIINDEMIEIFKNFEILFNDSDKVTKKELVTAIVDKILVHDWYNVTIHYKDFGFNGWKLKENIIIETDKSWISQKEKARIFKKYIK